MKINRLLAKTILIFLLTLLSSPRVFAISRFERLLPHPGKIVLIVLAAAGTIAGVLIGMSYLNRLREISKAREAKAEVARRKENKQVRERQIPVGPVEDVSFPPGKLLWESAHGIDIKRPGYTLSPKEEFCIGRLKDNHLQLSDLAVSRQHAKVRPEREGYVLYDLVSTRGTRVNGKKIDRHILRDGDNIKIGTNVFTFRQEKRR